ncbi:Rap1a/Tai family immunity protein [uncultured Azonexus sp.]|uniref:Rap1a/Tai family immunity protein n=1 Tax=uncultured Azonexus sp. TaxID=520307 RepID=UPI002610A6C6|nr:Rap1a/Tai family immunity protein [uncultured Azonexus sp.]
MIRLLILCAALFAGHAHAYTAQEMLEDCRSAERLYAGEKNTDPFFAIRSNRCISYVAGFADGYAVGDFLAGKIGVRINAFCLPNDADLSLRLVRAVVIHVERVPPDTTVTTATLVAGALAKAFPCPEVLEPKK